MSLALDQLGLFVLIWQNYILILHINLSLISGRFTINNLLHQWQDTLYEVFIYIFYINSGKYIFLSPGVQRCLVLSGTENYRSYFAYLT